MQHEIDGEMLLLADEATLDELKIKMIGRKIIKNQLRKLVDEALAREL